MKFPDIATIFSPQPDLAGIYAHYERIKLRDNTCDGHDNLLLLRDKKPTGASFCRLFVLKVRHRV